MSVLKYSALRVGLIAVIALILWLCNLGLLLSLLLAPIIGMMISYLLFPRQRNQAAKQLEVGTANRSNKRRSASKTAELDAEYEDTL